MRHSSLSITPSGKNDLVLPFLSAWIIVMFLFFIDEGYYDFRWMADAGNWVVLVLYLSVIFVFQWLISWFLLGRITGARRIWIMLGAVMPATILLLLWLMS